MIRRLLDNRRFFFYCQIWSESSLNQMVGIVSGNRFHELKHGLHLLNRAGILFVLIVGCGSRGPIPSPEVANQAAPTDVDEHTAPRAAQSDDWFEDRTARTGVRFSYHNGQKSQQFTLLETVGGGVAMIDYDQDGDLDLYFTGGGVIPTSHSDRPKGTSGALYRNDGDWNFTDVTQTAGLKLAGDYSHGCEIADFDRDGWPDIFVTCYGQCQLFHNLRNGQFCEVAVTAGIVTSGWQTAAAWSDVDRDGWPDLYIASYVEWQMNPDEFCGNKDRGERDVCLPNSYPPSQDRLFRNRRDGTFEEITKLAGINNLGRGLGVVSCDFNRDGWIDFYVANDAGANQLYLGGASFPFEETATLAGCAFNEFGAPEGSMGITVADYDGDALPDIFVTNFEFEDNSLYRNLGNGQFVHSSVSTGMSGKCRRYVGFGTVFADFNQDGWEDVVISNGHVQYRRPPLRQPAVLFQNVNGKRFMDVSNQAGPYFSVPHIGRGVAAGDLDNNGTLDIVVVHQNDPVVIMKNRAPIKPWLGVQLIGKKSNPDAIGATVSTRSSGRTITRFVVGGGSYLSSSDRRIIFPLDSGFQDDMEHETPEITVNWPSGQTECYSKLTPGKYNRLLEGSGESR